MAKSKGKTRSNLTTERGPSPESNTSELSFLADPQSRKMLMALASLWAAAVTLLFYTAELPNAQLETRLDFWMVWPQAATALLPGPSASLVNLWERVPYWGIAGAIVCSAIALGDRLLGIIFASRAHFRGKGQEADAAIMNASLHVALAAGLGISALSLVTLGVGWFGLLWRPLFVLLLLLPLTWTAWARRNEARSLLGRIVAWRPDRWNAVLGLASAPFAAALVLGASLPSVSFDNREYHLQGPREFFEAGQISFLEHNVYTSFPFLAEMPVLLGMVLTQDPWSGAIVGQLVLCSFAFSTALLLLSVGRTIGPGVGAAASFAWLTSPWCYRVSSTIAFVEGALAFYVMAVFAAGLVAWRTRQPRWWLVVGLLAGSGMACKYPGLVQTVVPAGLLAVAAAIRSRRTGTETQSVPVAPNWFGPVAFSMGVVITFGPWSLKNLIETGNPVYPLAYSVFGGVDLDADWAAKWAGGHSPPFNVLAEPLRAVPDGFSKLSDVFIKNDWQTPLVATFAPLALISLFAKRRLSVLVAAVYVGWLYVMWWALTHQIDRFWVPLLPVACLLAGVGMAWPKFGDATEYATLWRRIVIALIGVSYVYHGPFIAVGLAGFQPWLSSYETVNRLAADTELGVKVLNTALPAGGTALLIGEAQVFDLKHPAVYNTVFDESIFQQLTTADPTPPDRDQQLADRDVICQRFERAGVTHVFVNWQEVLRYRNSYGYTDFVTPKRFRDLVELGVLKPTELDFQQTHSPWESLNDSTKSEIERWGPELKRSVLGTDAFVRFQLFKVVCGSGE